MWHYHLVNAHPLEELFFEWKVSKILPNLLYGKVSILSPYAVKSTKPQSISSSSIAQLKPAQYNPSVTAWTCSKMTKTDKSCFQSIVINTAFSSRKNPDWFFYWHFSGLIKRPTPALWEEAKSPCNNTKVPQQGPSALQRSPFCRRRPPEARSTSQEPEGSPACLPGTNSLWEETHVPTWTRIWESWWPHTLPPGLQHTSAQGSRAWLQNSTGEARSLAQQESCDPIRPCKNTICSQATGSRQVQGSPPSNRKVTVTPPGQSCTALQSLTFPEGMREPLLCPCPTAHECSRHPLPPPGSDALM